MVSVAGTYIIAHCDSECLHYGDKQLGARATASAVSPAIFLRASPSISPLDSHVLQSPLRLLERGIHFTTATDRNKQRGCALLHSKPVPANAAWCVRKFGLKRLSEKVRVSLAGVTLKADTHSECNPICTNLSKSRHVFYLLSV